MNYFRIFNRWGELIFETNNPAQGWDGNKNGTPQPVDTYVWTIEGKDKDGKLIQKSGNFLLIK
jgi:gliding motility-associated-like protein